MLQNYLYTGEFMKRSFYYLMLFVFVVCSSIAALAETQPDPTVAEGKLKFARSSSADSGEIPEAGSTEYIRRRMEQLEALLYEKTRKEVIKEKSEEQVKYKGAQQRLFDERRDSENVRVTTASEKEIDRAVRERIDTELEIDNFGRKFFAEGEITQASLFAGVAPSNYHLGPGDELKIIVWSDLGDETVYDVQVNPEGQVYIPILGVLGVTGQTVGQFEQAVIGQLTGKFQHFKGQVTLTKVRTIQIFVVGEVEKPGAMTVSGLATAFVALYKAGGPTSRGSMRNIKVLSSNGRSADIDLYHYLLSGDRTQDVSLKNGDTVFVPAVQSLVTIKGFVTRPAIYEVRPNTSLSQLLEMAGNVTGEAYSGRVKVTRWSGDGRKETFDVHLADNTSLTSFAMHNGDEVVVERAIEAVGNKIKLEGPVSKPGEYSAIEGLRVMDLVARAGGFVNEEIDMHQAHVYRMGSAGRQEIIAFSPRFAMLGESKDNIVLEPLDRVRFYAAQDIQADTRVVIIEGSVRRPGEYIFREGMRLADMIVQANGLSVDASGDIEIARSKSDRTSEVIKVNAHMAMRSESSQDNIALQPLDRISVMATGDAVVTPEVVYIKGNVRRPGPYAILERGEKLSSLIKRAGGLTDQAFPEGAVFMRRLDHISSVTQLETAKDVQSEMFRQATLDLRADLLRAGAKIENSQTSKAETGDTITEQVTDLGVSESAASVATRAVAQETSAFGNMEMGYRRLQQRTMRIPVPVQEIIDGRADEFEDIVLMPGDQLTIPVKPSTVTILGAVINPTSILFHRNRDASYYINRAGGFSSHSNHRRTVIIRPNGEVRPMRSVRKIERGDIILVPPKPNLVRPDKIKEVSNIASILGNLAVTYKIATD